MSSVSKFLFVALAAVSGVAASASPVAEPSHFQAKSVIASHEAAPALSAVVHHRHHRHRHVRHAAPVHR